MRPATRTCSGCSTEIPSETPGGFCPACLLSTGLDDLADEEVPDTDLTPLLSATKEPLGVKYHSIGDYQLLEEIARGGMGVVFRARQISLNRIVALKVIQARWIASPEALKRFRFEAEAAAALEHPNIVPIYEVGSHDDNHYFSMKFVEGGSLARRLSKRRAFGSAREIGEFVMKVARAIHFAHQHGIVHRDLKPGNILLDAMREPHVTDFGLAMGLETDSLLTRSGEILGTPAYMSPEQAAGEGKITTATDIYSVGAILYELLTGKPPFCGATAVETLRKVLYQEPKRPRALNPALDRDLETICLRCLEKDPARRYPSADALANDLENFLAYRPILARSVGPVERALKWSRRQPILAGALGGLIFIGLLGVSGILWQWRRAEQHALRERRHRERAEIATAQAQQALTQMEAVQLGRAEEFIQQNNRIKALPYWALILRQNPGHQMASERLLSTLTQRPWAVLAQSPLLHSNRLTSALFSRDGSRIVTASLDHTAAVWDSATAARICGPLYHDAGVEYAELSPDGSLVMTASDDRTVRFWNAQTGAPATEPLRFGGTVTVAKFSPDGSHFGAVVRRTKIHIGSAPREAGQDSFEFDVDADDGEFSSDGRMFAGNSVTGNVAIIDLARRAILARLRHPDRVRASVFHPVTNQIATACYDGKVRLWEIATGREIRAFAHVGPAMTVEFSKDGRYIVTGDDTGLARVWNVRTGNAIGKPLRHGSSIRSAGFSPEGQRIVTSSWDQTARLWDVLTGNPLCEPMTHPNPLFWAQFDPSGQQILTVGRGNAVSIWSIPPSRSRSRDNIARVQSAEFRPDGSGILISSSRGVEELDAKRLQSARVFVTNEPPAGIPARYVGGGKHVALYRPPDLIQILETRTGKVTREIRTTTNILYFAITSDLRWLVTMDQQDIQVLNLATPNPNSAAESLPHPKPVQITLLSPDNEHLLTLAQDGVVRIWTLTEPTRLAHVVQSEAPITTVAYSNDGLQVATTDEDKNLRLWNSKTGKPTGIRVVLGFKAYQCLFSPDGRRLAVRVGDPVWLFDPDTGRLIAGPITHTGLDGDSRIAFSPDSRKLVTSGHGTLHFWSSEDGSRIAESVELGSDSRVVSFHPHDDLVFCATANDAVCMFNSAVKPFKTPAWLAPLAEALAGSRFGNDGQAIVLSAKELWQVQQDMITETRADSLGRWARWFLHGSEESDESARMR